MEVFDKVTAGPDAAGLDADRFSGIPGDAARGRADADDVRAFERALAGADKAPAQSASRAPHEEKRSLKEGADFSQGQARVPERTECSEGKAASGAGAAEGKPGRDPAPSPAPGAAQRSDQKPDQKPALKPGESGEAPRAQHEEDPRRGSAKGLNEEDFLAAMFGRGAQGPGALSVNAEAVSPAAAGASEASAPKGAALGEAELSRLVDRILVGSPEKGGSEVRLVLADRVLPGTEIRLSRDAAGALQVTVETRDEAAFQTLVGARNDLERALQAAEKGGVSLEMRREGGDEDDMRRRSRGLEEQGYPG